jgi:hypothetical protein
VTADRDDPAARIGCRLVADVLARAPAAPDSAADARIVVEPVDPGDIDVLMLEALRIGREAGWQVERTAEGVELAGDGDPMDVARRLVAASSRAVYCGVGGGPGDARAALLRARSAGAANVAVSLDAGRSSASDLLAPLERLGGRRADTAIRTLQVYLDNWGSLIRCGEVLHLHPNAVAHRMKRIRALLPIDLDDPEQRLAVQIACRGRVVASQPPV